MSRIERDVSDLVDDGRARRGENECPPSRAIGGGHVWQYLTPGLTRMMCQYCDEIRPVTSPIYGLASGTLRPDPDHVEESAAELRAQRDRARELLGALVAFQDGPILFAGTTECRERDAQWRDTWTRARDEVASWGEQ